VSNTMTRSRNQLASAYAPESFFTYEGGLGACIAQSMPTTPAPLDLDTRKQIAARMDEVIHSWHAAARSCRTSEQPQVVPAQCLDQTLLTDTGDVAPFNEARFTYFTPEEMAYTWAPLTFVCKTCKLVRSYESIAQAKGDLAMFEKPEACPHPKGKQGRCDWRQLDVLYVHWSGNWAPMMPHQYQWDSNKKEVVLRRGRCGCGCEDFTLDQTSPAIGEWFFRCASCTQPLSAKPFQNDKDTLEILGDQSNNPANLTEARMELTSYRASQAYYVQADQFINFRDDQGGHLRLLLPSNVDELEAFTAEQFGFDRSPYTEEELEQAIKGSADARTRGEWDQYQSQTRSVNQLESLVPTMPDLLEALDNAKLARKQLVKDWEERKLIRPRIGLPPILLAALHQRAQRFSSRYDPFRLAVEHAALRATKLDPNLTKGGRRAFVPFDRLDEDLSPDTTEQKQQVELETRGHLDQLGIETMGLIREFDLCRFSFGYSRMSALPVLLEKRNMDMPVRLRLFPPVRADDRRKNPIYVITQANEAIYVKLNEDMVYEWLRRLSCGDFFAKGTTPGWRVGAGLLEVAPEFDRHLQKLVKFEKGHAYYYAYTLLHTYAHVLMKQIAEFSGLDIGSLGEYLFPADLAFVVYRSGTTMDLGNLSALWRNSNVAFLRSLRRVKTLECGSGSPCLHRGCACPDCIMVPETSCIAANKLLSRAVLRGNGRPLLDPRIGGPIEGFLDVVHALRMKQAA